MEIIGTRVAVLVTLAVVTETVLLFFDPMTQSQSYYNFADQRPILGVPDFFNATSNLAFAVMGAMGLWSVFTGLAGLRRGERWTFGAFFGGALLMAFGSGWFHLWPSKETLVWDRLAMALTFMAFLSAMISERISPRAGAVLLLPLMAAGAASVVYWGKHDNLGPYYMVQGFSLLSMLYIGPAFKWQHIPTRDLFIALSWYALAMALDLRDKQVFDLICGELLSGHTIKHLSAAMGICWMVRTLKKTSSSPLSSGRGRPEVPGEGALPR